jgi:hypothetical protein
MYSEGRYPLTPLAVCRDGDTLRNSSLEIQE